MGRAHAGVDLERVKWEYKTQWGKFTCMAVLIHDLGLTPSKEKQSQSYYTAGMVPEAWIRQGRWNFHIALA